MWKRKLEAEAVLFLWKRKREKSTASVFHIGHRLFDLKNNLAKIFFAFADVD